jgi:glycosyltransferase involved in cell wall biosynthesis
MVKNVCLIVQHPYPLDVRVRKEAMALLSHGHKVSVIALRDANEDKQEVVGGVKVYRGGFQKKRSGKFRYLLEYIAFFLYSFFKLNLLDSKERFDVVHINTLPDFLVFSAVIQKLKGRRIVLDMHEIMPEFFMSKFRVGIGHPLVLVLLFLERISLKFADDVITINEPIKGIFQSRSIPGKPVTVIMNTVSASTVKNNEKKAHQGFNCVYHGTLTDIYGLDIAIEGFSKVSGKFPDMSFHIFGDGQSLPQLKQLTEQLNLQQSIIFHGEMAYDKMMESLTEMDLGILAIRKDIFLNLSFSNKLAEYLYLKIPVISSDLDATKYYFNDEHILFFEAGNADDLGQKIQFAYMNRERARVMAESAYEKSKSLDWDVMAKRYLEVIERDQGKQKGNSFQAV